MLIVESFLSPNTWNCFSCYQLAADFHKLHWGMGNNNSSTTRKMMGNLSVIRKGGRNILAAFSHAEPLGYLGL
jgi:hypothetical protein